MSAWTVNIPNVIMWLLWIYITYRFIVYRDSKLTERENRQAHRELQEWFHENYILNGVDPVLAYVSFLKHSIPDMDEFQKGLTRERLGIKTQDFPMMQLNRVIKLLGANDIKGIVLLLRSKTAHIAIISGHYNRQKQYDYWLPHINEIETHLTTLAHELLGTEIVNKLSTEDICIRNRIVEIKILIANQHQRLLRGE